MIFARVLTAAVTILSVLQALAAPSSRPLLTRERLSIEHSASEMSTRSPASLSDILSSVRTKIDSIKVQLASTNGTAETAKAAAAELKATFDSFAVDVKSLKESKMTGQSTKLNLSGLFDPKSWPIVGDVYAVVKDILIIVDEIKALASAETSGERLKSIFDILGTIVQAAPSVITIAMAILPLR